MKASSRTPFSIIPVVIRDDGEVFAYGADSMGSCPVVLSNFARKPTETVLNGHEKSVIGLAFRSDLSLISCSFDSHLCHWSASGDLVATSSYRTEHRVDGFTLSAASRIKASCLASGATD